MKLDETKKLVEEQAEDDMCGCGKNPATEPHSCPYAEEIGDNDDPEYCTCCDDCRHECCMDI